MPDPALDATIAQARELLHDLGPLSVRKMFGGAGIYHDGTIFALIVDHEILLKARDGFAEEMAALGSTQWVYEMKGKSGAMPYWSLPDSALDDAEEATALARRALEHLR